MKKILVKAALPTLAESGHGWDDISALRWIPTRREKTFAKPLPIFTPEKRSSSETWEKNIEDQIDFQNKFGDKFSHIQPSNPLERPVPIPHWKNPKTVGTFVAPATQRGIPADTTIGPGVESTLLGILGERGKPSENFFWRTPRQGAMFESEGEGFKFGGYDPKSFVKIPTSQKLTPMKLDRYNWALENPVQPPQKIMTQSMINEIENLKNRFPDVPTRDIWGPSTLEINPLMEGFHPDDYKVASESMDLAWRLLKMPIVDTDIPGVRMGYNQRWIHPHNYPEPIIGNQPYFEGWEGKRNEDDKIIQMTPNEYFDIIQAHSEKEGGVDRGVFTAPPIPGRDAEYRWDGMQFSPWSNSRKNIARIMEGIEEGKPIGMPSLTFQNDDFTGIQDGGHRMEALRQMGHGDTSVPVFRYHQQQVKTGEPMNLAWRMLKAQQTIDAYSRENVEEGFEPDVQNVIIASKPGAENINAEEQSRLHDEMLRRISELEGSENIRIMSARGRSQEWGDENSLMLSNVPDDMLHEIHSLAGEFNQDSILHSPKGMAGTQFVDSSGESEGGLESGSFTEEEPPNYTEFPTGQKYAYGDYVAVNKGQDYHPSVGGYLQQQQQFAPSEGSTMMDPENPGGEITVQEPMNVGYDGRPLPDERVELGDWFWDDMLHADGTHNQWDRLSSQEKDEVKERVTSGLHGLLNPDGSWNDWALKNLKHESPLSPKSGPSIAFRTHLYGPDGFRQHEDGSNGDSIIAVVNSHSKRDKRGGSIPGLRTVMLRNSEFMGPKSQVFKPRGHGAGEHRHGVDVRNVMQHHGEQKNNQPVSLHGVKRKQKQEWKRRFGRGGRFRKGYPVYVLNQLGDVLVKYEDYSLTEGKSNFDDAVNAEYQQNLAVDFAEEPTRWKRTIPMRIDEQNMVFSEDKNFEPIEHAITSPTRQAILQAIYDSQESDPEGPQGFPSPHYPNEPMMNQYWGEDMDIRDLLEQQMYLSGRGEDELERRGLDFKSPVFAKSHVLVKERVSPEAKRHKLEYDTAYEASPERRKYRADLNRERRRRGMYGDHSGRDISHTEGGKLTVEGAHENRARHFKDQGTLRHVGVKKKVNDARKANLIGVVPPLKGENE